MTAALAQAWPPFVLVLGLLLVGRVAADDNLFASAAARLERLPGPGAVLLAACLALVALTTAVLNLDTAAVFLTPVLVLAARRRGIDETPFLYGALFMCNAASLFLPGSNLTNLLVLHGEHVSGAHFAVRLLPAAVAATLVTAGGIAALHRRRLRASERPILEGERLGGTLGMVGAAMAASLMLELPDPALPVLVVGVAIAAIRVAQGRLRPRDALRTVNPLVTLALFALAVGLGVLARSWALPGRIVRGASAVGTAALGALAAILVNNLPAAALLGAMPPAHPRALLLGLNLGPNLAVTGSLSAYLWATAARSVGAQPSARAVTRQGILLAPPAIAAALAAMRLLAPGRL